MTPPLPPTALRPSLAPEFALLGLLALLWGSSYLFIKVAVAEIPPLSLIAYRVTGAALLLCVVMALRGRRLPRDRGSWGRLFIQSLLNASLAWVLLAWGQQYTDAGLASVLNSTSPAFVVLMLALFGGQAAGRRWMALCGAGLGLAGVLLIVGVEALDGLGRDVAGQAACLLSAMLYAGAALHGRRLQHLGADGTAAGTMICAAVVLVPAALLLDQPWRLRPSAEALGAATALSVLCTGLALLIYFRLVRSLGPMGAASQSFLRMGVGVALGVALLGESVSAPQAAGLLASLAGVALINMAGRARRA